MYDRILVPTDGSPGSERAVRHAIDFAATYDATLHALSVVDDDTEGTEKDEDGVAARGDEALDQVRRQTTEAGPDVPFVGDRSWGEPAPEILRYVDASGIDLVVMGTHGRTGIERHLVGSVTEQVVRSAPVPVVTVGLRESTDAVTSEDDARAIAREAVTEEYDVEHVDLEPGAYREEHAWVFEGSAGSRHVTVYVDRATGDPHVVTAPVES